MKRDWELIRKILLAAEELEDPQGYISPNDIQGYPPEKVSYHMKLLIEAGLVEGTCTKALNRAPWCMVFGLTWEGHEFLDAIRNRTAWNRLVEWVREKGFELSFEALKIALKNILLGA